MKSAIAFALAILSTASMGLPTSRAENPCVSGLEPGKRPGPYTFLVSTGNERGQLTCFICETADKPAVLIFARTPSQELGELASRLDAAVSDPKN
jgi:hypothetical protein